MKISKDIIIKKLNQDDILEIIIEHFYDTELKKYPCARADILGEPGKDLRFIGAFGKEGCNEVFEYDIAAIDKTHDYNGDHAYLKEYPECIIKPSSKGNGTSNK